MTADGEPPAPGPDPAPAASQAPAPQPLLDRERNLGELLTTTFSIFGRHAAVLYVLTLLLLAPATLLIDGVWGGELRDGTYADPSWINLIVSWVVTGLVLTAAVTGAHVAVVQRLARGEEVSIGQALRDAAPRVGAIVVVSILYVLAIFGGFLLLVVPGIWLSTSLYFGAQVAVAERRSAWDSLKRSFKIVEGQWWRAFGLLTLSYVLFYVVASPLLAAIAFAENALLYVTLTLIFETLCVSITALFGTLLFFDLRTRADATLYPDAPDRDFGGFLPPAAPDP